MIRPLSSAMASPVFPTILRCAQLRELEQHASSLPLMERAGRAAADTALESLGGRPGTVLVLAGPGNNGGDAFVVARHLRAAFCNVTVVFAGDAARLPRDAAEAHRAWLAHGGSTVADLPPRWQGDLVVDGLFGIGLKRAVEAPYAGWIEWTHAQSAKLLALDVPSGIDADSGARTGPAVSATATATFLAWKPGLLTSDGIDASGTVTVHDLGVTGARALSGSGELVGWTELARILPDAILRRRHNVHKGTFGVLGIVGGAAGMIGAPLLGGRAALKTGTGRVRVGYAATDHPAMDPVAPELMVRDAQGVLDAGVDVLVVGPGLGTDARGEALLARALALEVPLVVDADALTLLGRQHALRDALARRQAPLLLTPHPAEAGRLLDCDTAAVERDRVAAALALAEAFRAHVVLKGAGSIIAHPGGAWSINASGNAGLATAGSGDVLAGIIGSLLAQGVDPAQALRIGVSVHGAAADALAAQGDGPLGIVASELGDAARRLLNAAGRAKGSEPVEA